MATRKRTQNTKTIKPEKTIVSKSDTDSSSEFVQRKKKDYSRFDKFIFEISESGIRKESLEMINKSILIMCEKIVKNADHILQRTKKKTLSDSDIASSVLLTVPPPRGEETDLAKEANKKGRAAVERYIESKKENEKSDKKVSRSSKAGLIFPITRIKDRILEYSSMNKIRIGERSAIHLTAVLEYLTNEILVRAGKIALNSKPKHVKIIPRDIKLAIEGHSGLKKLSENVFIPGGIPVHLKKV